MKTIHRALVVLILASTTSAPGVETLHLERYFGGGKTFVRLLVPVVTQTDKGITVVTVNGQTPGPTTLGKWISVEYEVNFPTIALSERIDMNFWNEESPHPSGTVIFTGPQHYHDDSEPLQPHPFAYDWNGGWVDSKVLRWTNILHYPWIFHANLGWTYVLPTEPVWHGMAWYGFSLEKGWIYLAEVVPETVFVFQSGGAGEWTTIW